MNRTSVVRHLQHNGFLALRLLAGVLDAPPIVRSTARFGDDLGRGLAEISRESPVSELRQSKSKTVLPEIIYNKYFIYSIYFYQRLKAVHFISFHFFSLLFTTVHFVSLPCF
jgi:hypothetical protein